MSEETDGFFTDAHVLLRKKTVQVSVDGLARVSSRCKNAVRPFHAVDDVNQIRQHVEHSKVVLDNNDALFLSQLLNDFHDPHAFVDIEIRGRFVKKIHIGISEQCGAYRDPLELTAGEFVQRSAHEMIDAQVHDQPVQLMPFVDLFQEGRNCSRDPFRYPIDVLGLERHLHRAFLNGAQEVPQFSSRKGFNDLAPSRFFVFPIAKIWHQATGKDAHRR